MDSRGGRPVRVLLENYEVVVRETDARRAPDRYRDAVPASVHSHLRALGERVGTANPWVVDGVLAVVFVIAGLASTAGRGGVPGADYRPNDALSVLLVLAASVPFVFLRRAPLTVLLIGTASVSLIVALGYNQGLTPFFLLVATVTVGANCPSRTTAFAAVAVGVALVLLVAVDAPSFSTSTFATQTALFATMFMVGITLRNRRTRVAALEERTLAVEREKEEESRRAVADERLHIARELHDVVAHSMGVIAIQASMGERVISEQPEQAERALQAISSVSRSTLAEIRRMLGVLRDPADEIGVGAAAAYTPAPGLDELDRLVRELDEAGVPVAVAYDGRRVELPRGVDLSGYRIVQEALTNVLKHAGRAHASVLVRYEPGALSLEIVDDGRGVNGRAESTGRSGHGLVGMRERVAVYGGTFEAGPRVGGGFRVAARLPYGDPS
jgi:signal transduction histidine kinase